MLKKVSEYLGVNTKAFDRYGVFDAVLGVDTQLFLDPRLLKGTRIPEFTGSRKKIEKYYGDVIRLLLASSSDSDLAWREARRRLIFPETKGVSIGYGMHSSDGSAVGPRLGLKLLRAGQEVLDMGIRDPEVFELLGLFEEDFGADRLSDMTIRIITDDLLAYSQRITKKFGVGKATTVNVTYGGKSYVLYRHPQKKSPLIFIPSSLLSPLPVALSHDGIDYVVSVNRELRQELNKLVGSVAKRVTKRQLKELVFQDPKNIRELLKHYKSVDPPSYDFDQDPAGEVTWLDGARNFASRFPLSQEIVNPTNLDSLNEAVGLVMQQFKRLIEANGLNELLWLKVGSKHKPRHEKFAQKLFYGIADSYCAANNIDLSREPNAGSGPVDFKLSQGYHVKVVVEVKLTSNRSLVSGFHKQLPVYQESEQAHRGIYLIIRNTASEQGIKNVQEERALALGEGKRVPDLVVIDARLKPTASKR